MEEEHLKNGKKINPPILADHLHCTGCTACYSACPVNCIEMMEDEEGFLFPEINSSICLGCGKCENVCPVLKDEIAVNQDNIAYAAYTKQQEIRNSSSSGGLFTELALVVLGRGGIVYGAAFDDHFAVKHIKVENITELSLIRCAKYSQSRIDETFKEIKQILIKGQMVLFSGTPCQVAGLKALVGNRYDRLLVTVDFVCHSIPSPLVWKKYVRYRAAKDNKGVLPETINMRSKSTGWSRYNYSVQFNYSDEIIYSVKNSNDLYMKLFVEGSISRRACENCHFKGYNRVSDITIGDFWGIWDIMPEMDDNGGTSLVLIHSENGRRLFAHISEKINYRSVELDETSRCNPNMLMAFRVNKNRSKVMRAFHEDDIGYLERTIIRKKSIVSFIKNRIKLGF